MYATVFLASTMFLGMSLSELVVGMLLGRDSPNFIFSCNFYITTQHNTTHKHTHNQHKVLTFRYKAKYTRLSTQHTGI